MNDVDATILLLIGTTGCALLALFWQRRCRRMRYQRMMHSLQHAVRWENSALSASGQGSMGTAN